METFQRKTEIIFTRLTLENALDRQDWDQVLRMSLRLDSITTDRLKNEVPLVVVTA